MHTKRRISGEKTPRSIDTCPRIIADTNDIALLNGDGVWTIAILNISSMTLAISDWVKIPKEAPSGLEMLITLAKLVFSNTQR